MHICPIIFPKPTKFIFNTFVVKFHITSLPPDPLIGFWLVKKENVRSVLLPVPQSEAFALPG